MFLRQKKKNSTCFLDPYPGLKRKKYIIHSSQSAHETKSLRKKLPSTLQLRKIKHLHNLAPNPNILGVSLEPSCSFQTWMCFIQMSQSQGQTQLAKMNTFPVNYKTILAF